MEGNHKGIGGSKICPFFLCAVYPAGSTPMRAYICTTGRPQNLSCSHRNLRFEHEPACEITGITAMHFLRPECRGGGPYVLKVTKSNNSRAIFRWQKKVPLYLLRGWESSLFLFGGSFLHSFIPGACCRSCGSPPSSCRASAGCPGERGNGPKITL